MIDRSALAYPLKHFFLPILGTAILCNACRDDPKVALIEVDPKLVQRSQPGFEVYDLFTLNTAPSPKATVDTSASRITIATDEPFFGLIRIEEQQIPLYTDRKYDLKIDERSDSTGALRFVGVGAEVNNYFSAVSKLEDASFSREPYTYSLHTEAFKARMDSLENALDTVSTASLSAKELDLVQRIRKLKSLNYQLQYLISTHGKGHPIPDSLLPSWSELENHLELYDLKYPDYGITLHFFLDVYFYNEFRKPAFHPDETTIQAFYVETSGAIQALDISEPLKELLLAKNLSWAFLTTGFNPSTESLYRTFAEAFPETESLVALRKTYAEITRLQPGGPAPNISGLTPDGKTLGLQDLQGQILYIDIWATWCAPCIREFPASRSLADKYKNDAVHFVYLSIDQDQNQWRQFLERPDGPQGIHLIVSDPQAMMEMYQLLEIPRYLIIGPDGKIVDARAPAPSSGAAAEMIDSLLRDGRLNGHQ